MGLYGYVRESTPELSKLNKNGDLLLFNNAYSCHTHTVPVLKLALTQANQYNGKTYYNSLSIIDIFKKANIQTYWLTNQILYGPWDNLISIIGQSADHIVALNKHIGPTTRTNKFDGALIDEVKKVLSQNTNKNRIIVVHLMGSHATYSSRYPHNKYSIFDADKLVGNKIKNAKKLNVYDNAIAYNDYVVSSIIKLAKQNKGTYGVFYMSDHSEEIIKYLAHNSAKFTWQMTQIPMFAYFSDDYKAKYPNKYKNLVKHKDAIFSNDLMYDTLIGAFGIKTDKYNPKNDLSSSKYSLREKDALALHGTKHYIDASNHIYWQRVNAKYLTSTKQATRVFPHRVNSRGKLHDIINNGFYSYEFDTYFTKDDKFYIGHDKPTLSDVTLEDTLSNVSYNNLQKVWMDFKNLNKDNADLALQRLEELDKKFNIKNKFILAFWTKGEFFHKFSKAGWHTSYYLPTGKVIDLLKQNNKQELDKLAMQLAKQVKLQKVSAVSFDTRLYEFVKKYLESKISKDIVYHTWMGPKLYSTTFKKDLQKMKVYQDKRVKTILCKYDSQFDFF